MTRSVVRNLIPRKMLSRQFSSANSAALHAVRHGSICRRGLTLIGS